MLPSLLALAEVGIKLGAAEGTPDGLGSFPADYTSLLTLLLFSSFSHLPPPLLQMMK